MSYRDSDAIQRNWIAFYIVITCGITIVLGIFLHGACNSVRESERELHERKQTCIEQGWSPERCK